MGRDSKRVVLGQFFTKEKIWLKPQVLDFINASGCDTAFDPFAGGGHLLAVAKKLGFDKTIGMDIDERLGWEFNDSLLSIPHISDKTIIITNPPYLSNYSASRKKLYSKVKKYFDSTPYNDLYLLSLDNMIESKQKGVAIIPETFINSNFKRKEYLTSITIIEENPFDDTDTPILVVCFDGIKKNLSEVLVYKNECLVNNLKAIENMRLLPKKNVEIIFNDINGWLAIRCVDTTNPLETLRFDEKKNIKYDWGKGLKKSSRLLTLVDVKVDLSKRAAFIDECNSILNKLRKETGDIIFSPFKGNMKNGHRRRRLDFKTCRAIIELAYKKIIN